MGCKILSRVDQNIGAQNIEVEDWSKEILVGQADAWTSQLGVSAKLIMEIVWMRTPQPFVNLRPKSSSSDESNVLSSSSRW